MAFDVLSKKPKQASKSAFDCAVSTLRNGVLGDFFPQIKHPCFDLPTLSVTFIIKISTHTCKRKNNFICTAIAHNFVLVQSVFKEWREFERKQARTSGYTHQNSNLVHA